MLVIANHEQHKKNLRVFSVIISVKKRRFEPQGIENSRIEARDCKSRAATNHEQLQVTP